ncbi:hypothetical protein AVEN_93801-1 [Araneus ventricosus]|uniref:Uncharacterized protein n=1 Tax=Araneus ventricosus TaxID=182803 RepID=A0A4Y2AYA4_ARAVE|nr:hypothetical protein AVEN_93801-1 [Araneus ventricosus]
MGDTTNLMYQESTVRNQSFFGYKVLKEQKLVGGSPNFAKTVKLGIFPKCRDLFSKKVLHDNAGQHFTGHSIEIIGHLEFEILELSYSSPYVTPSMSLNPSKMYYADVALLESRTYIMWWDSSGPSPTHSSARDKLFNQNFKLN